MLVPRELLQRADYRPTTRSDLAAALRALGVREGGVLMAHVRMSALGWMVGGMDAIVLALRDAVGDSGTMMAFTGWEDSPYHVADWPPAWQDAYRDQPPFDPEVSASRREFGRFPERLRTWPGSRRSGHPEVSFCACGPEAGDLLADPADDDPWGKDGPLGRLVQRDGQVIMIGAPLKTLTLCHHAEAIARVGGKRFRDYAMPVRREAGTEWVHYRTLDTFYGALPYWDRPDLAVDSPAGKLAGEAVAAGTTSASMINNCPLVLVDAPAAVRAAVTWIEDAFAAG